MVESVRGSVGVSPGSELFLPFSDTPYFIEGTEGAELVLLVCRPPRI